MKKNISHVLEELVKKLGSLKGLAAAYLFGSVATGTYTDSSDIDLALLFEGDSAEYVDRLELMAHLSRIAGRDVEVVIINNATPRLYHEIMKTGKIILEKNSEVRIKKEMLNRKLYQDYRHIHSIYINGLKNRYAQNRHS